MGKYFKGWKFRPYRFVNRAAQRKFKKICVDPTGAIYLNEMIDDAKRFGYWFPEDLEARSYYHPDTLIEPSNRYSAGGSMGNYDNKALNRAYDLVARMFLVEKVQPITLREVEFHSTTNAGLPTLLSKEEVYEESISEAISTLKGQAPTPVLLGNRGKNLEETRPIWMFPFSMTLIESMFFQPLQRAIMDANTPWAGAMRKLTLACRLNEIIHQSKQISLLDYSGFDGSISSKLISMAFNILEQNFEMDEHEQHAWELVKRYFVTTPVVAPDGQLYTGKRHGVPSGSMFTQLIDSVVNALAISYVSIVTHKRITRFYVLGDDSVIGWKHEAPTVEEIRYHMEQLGIRVNTKKSHYLAASEATMEQLHFLGHTWDNMMPDRELDEVMTRLVTPERIDHRRAFSKDPAVKRQYYIDRIKAYMFDSQKAFPMLAKLYDWYAYPSMPLEQCGRSINMDWYVNAPTDAKEAYLTSVHNTNLIARNDLAFSAELRRFA